MPEEQASSQLCRRYNLMNVNWNHGINAPSLTRGITGKNIKPVAEHVAQMGSETADVLGSSLNTQMTQDLKALHRVVSAKETEAGKSALSATSFQTTAMVAGAILGAQGMVVTDMAGKLHMAAGNPEKLEQLASSVRDVTQEGAASAVLSGLSNQVLSSALEMGSKGVNAPVAMFMSGGYLQNEQSDGLLMQSVAQRQSEPLDFLMSDPRARPS